ncbi:transcription antitermination factor NusB [Fulvimarina sp. 2208YS6-2-32]|uniref:Transcription antitermination factor NusB n=1 Tax=Fulvimarina uroteuthidis TaxID=3098149 RepID=A0ABU5I7Z3_9HYPH|nr:transcription antitermination factor NusB [Fulvimarina sp. 2208YS6-2-32]
MDEGAHKPGLRARQVAAKLLAAVVEQQTSLDGLMDPEHGHPHLRQLAPRDQALVKAILITALRYRGTIAQELSERLDRPLPGNATTLNHHLHVAAAQIRFLDVPDSAAVDLAVTAAEADPRTRRFKGVVNALLRRLTRELAGAEVTTVPATDCPFWLFDRLVATYGKERATAIAEAHRRPAPIDLTVKSDPQGWADRLGGAVVAANTVRLDAQTQGSIASLEGFDAGEWWVQDASASLPVRLFGDLSGKTAADLCAAPGGKSAQLVSSGARVTACEASKSRARRLASNIARLKLDAEVLTGPFAETLEDRQFEAVLLDAPCSSTGTLRRHPDVGYTKTADDITRLAEVQRRLLDQATNHVAPGGTLVFSNCSIDREEGEDLIAAFLAEHAAFTRKPITRSEVPGFENAVTVEGDLRTTPDMLSEIGGVDGFFAARLVKAA